MKNKSGNKPNRPRPPNNVAEMVAYREAQQKHLDTLWDDLDTLYRECNALRTSPSRALILLKSPTLISQVSDIPALTRAAQVLARDMNEFTDKLATIYATHANQPRVTVDESKLLELLQIGEQYNSWIQSYQLVVIPSALAVAEFFATIPTNATPAVE